MKALLCSAMITLLMVLLTLVGAGADEWSQFRGPNGTGVSDTKGLPTEFGPQKNVVWKTELPPGHGADQCRAVAAGLAARSRG